MVYLKNHINIIIVLCILGILLGVTITQDLHTPEWSDETVMIKLAENFPTYSLTSDWVKNYPFYNTASKNLIELEYTMPIWHHPPLATIILVPFVRFTENVYILRGVTIALFLGSLLLVYLSIKKVTNRVWICFVPLLFFIHLLRGAIYLYHDAFMVFFFALTWYLVVNKSKWKYLVACLLVLTKTQAFLFLIPLVIKDRNWKMALPFFAIIPWCIWGGISNHNLFWVVYHWSNVSSTAFPEWGPVFGTGVWNSLVVQRLPIYLGCTLPILLVIRKNYGEVCLLVIALGLYYSWLCIDYHFLTMLITLPIVIATWIDKVKVPGRKRFNAV